MILRVMAACAACVLATDSMAAQQPAKALQPERANAARDFRNNPEYDRATADIAIGRLKSLRPGHGPAADVLAISLSGTDNIGHSYGTQGIEMCVQWAVLLPCVMNNMRCSTAAHE